MFECDRCKKNFKSKKGYNLHIVKTVQCIFKEVPEYVCKFCKTNFNCHYKLVEHLTSDEICIEVPNAQISNNSLPENFSQVNNTQLNTAILGNQNLVINYIDNSVKTKAGCKITNNPVHNEFLQSVNPPNFKDFPVDSLDYDKVKDVINFKDESLTDMIKEEYIDNIPPEMRAIWCLDSARNKFLLRIEDCWKLDIGGYKCYDKTMGKIEEKITEICHQKLYTNNNKIFELEDAEDFKFNPDLQHAHTQLKKENLMIKNFLKAMKKSKHFFNKTLKKLHSDLSLENCTESFNDSMIEFTSPNLITPS